MARYRHYDYGQSKLLPVSFERQVLPGTFEYTLNHLIDHEIDLSVFEARYANDETGAPAYDPAILLKVILLGYSRGVTASRQIARLCEENVLFMALSADTQPHFTTIASFIAGLQAEVSQVFRDVLLVCDEAGLIGREMFAVDGVKLPSNASKEWSGTRADYQKKVAKMERAVSTLMARHREADAKADEPLLIAALAMLVPWLIGHIARERGLACHYQANTVRQREVLSAIFLGVRIIERAQEQFTAAEICEAWKSIATLNAKAWGR